MVTKLVIKIRNREGLDGRRARFASLNPLSSEGTYGSAWRAGFASGVPQPTGRAGKGYRA